MKTKTVGILHYRIGKTDGVSLEIIKRKKVLEKLGYTVKLIAGPLQENSDYLIPLLEFDNPVVLKIRHNAFEKYEDFSGDKEFEKYITAVSDSIKSDFLKIHKKEKFDYLFIHNVFTHGRHIASAKAFYEIAQETKIKIISVNHDFWWVGSYKNVYKPTTGYVTSFLKKYVPPSLAQITHIAINTINQKALEKKINRKSILLPDTFDFEQKKWVKDGYNSDFLNRIGIKNNDLFVLQATRITKRKGIETAVNLVRELQKIKHNLIGQKLYNGKQISDNSDIVLVLAGYTEQDSLGYKRNLLKLIKGQGIKAVFISDYIGAERKTDKNKKIYSLWDAYVFSDIVTFPSIWEGWGNQFIEAVFAKKPVVLFEYPVFKNDIKKEGYEVISLGNDYEIKKENGLINIPVQNLKNASNKAIKVLTSTETPKSLEKNYGIGKKYHSEIILEKILKSVISAADYSEKHSL